MIKKAKNILFRGFVGSLIASLMIYLSPVPYAYANPVGGNVAAGNATITNSGNTETITQTGKRAVIDWQGFNINSGEKTQFVQKNAAGQLDNSALTVNRVHDINASKILGTLSANGNIVLINPNGVFFGPGSKIDVNGIIATASDVKNSEVMAGGKLHFLAGGNPNATVENQGVITAKDAGLVGLVAPNVINSGVITAKIGKVHMASGDSFTLDMYGDGLLEIGVSDDVSKQLVQNTGTIEAGTVKLTAAAGRKIVNSLIDVEGKISAPAFNSHDGEIDIFAEGSNAVKGNAVADKGVKQGASTVTVSGQLDASNTSLASAGPGNDGKGGKIRVLADNIDIQNGATINASGTNGGGKIKIGGNFHGAGEMATAVSTNVAEGAFIIADALNTGNGGNIAVWSDKYTNFSGKISAKGGPNGGNGGFVETSGKQRLDVGDNAFVDTSAFNGATGTWLMDPYNITIGTTDDGNGSIAGSNPTADANISHTTIENALNAGTNVTVTTGGSGSPGASVGDITLSNAISATTGTAGSTGALTLSAYRNIILNAGITLGGAGVTGGALTLRSDNGGNGSGYINVGGAIATNGGNITMGGGSGAITAGSLNADATINTNAVGFATGNSGQAIGILVNNVGVNAGGGNIIMNGKGYNTTTDGNVGIQVTGASGIVSTTGSGTINIAGTGQGSSNSGSNYGVEFDTGGIASTANNTLTVIATGGGVGSGGSNYGLYVGGTNSTIKSTGSGNVLANGTGGDTAGSGSANYGLIIQSASGIQAAGSGGVTVIGTGGTGSGGANSGLFIGGSIIGNGGAVSVTGIGGNNSGGFNRGIRVSGASAAISNAGTGTLSITGTGAGNTNSDSNYGVEVDNGGTISTVNGNLTINNSTGGGAGSGGTNYGVYVTSTNSTIKSTGSGNVFVTGTGGNASGSGGSNYGVYIVSANGIQAAGTGSVSVTGTGGNGSGSGGSNFGIYVNATSGISAAGAAGGVTVNGTGGNASGNGNYGILVNGGSITGAGGVMSITGAGGNGSGNSNIGVYVQTGTVSNTGSGTITVQGTGRGTTNSNSDVGVQVGAAGVISTVDGNLTINNTTGGGAGTGAYNYGVYITGAGSTIETTGSGNISITATGGNASGSGGSNNGVYVNAANGIQVTGTGGITVVGTGGNGSGSGTANYGVLVDTGNSITGNGGAMSITGTGGNSTGSTNIGTYVSGGTISNIGTGTLTVQGTGAGNTNSGSDVGVQVDAAGVISTINGNLTVNNTTGGGAGTGTNNYGAYVTGTNSTIKTTGSGNVSITGTGGNAAGSGIQNAGVRVDNANGIQTTGTGTITVAGTGGNGSGGTSNNNYGVIVSGSITGGSGDNVTITGTGGNSSGNQNAGIRVTGAGSAISATGTGILTLHGTGSGNTNSNSDYGIYVVSGGVISSANGNLIINNTNGGGAGTGTSNFGVFVTGTNSTIETTGSGNLSVTATGGNATGSGGSNYGVYVNSANGIQTTGTGTITVVGTGGNGTGGSGAGNSGVYVDTGHSITAASGDNVSITGTGGNSSGNSNYGIEVTGGTISTTGSGTMTLQATASGNTNSTNDYGLYLIAGGVISSQNGNLTVNNSTGGGAGTGVSNDGVYITGTNSTIETTGSGNVSVTGTGGNASGSGGSNIGVIVQSANGIQTTGTGSITVVGTGGNGSGSGANNVGVYVDTGHSITAASGDNVSITGTGGNSSGNSNYGIQVAGGTISTTGTGTITMQGTSSGNTNSSSDTGVEMDSGGVISSVNGNLTISNSTGGGAGSGTSNYGVLVTGTGSTIKTTGSGNLSVTGTGGNATGSGNYNYGIYVTNANGIQTTGTGTISVTGTGGNGNGTGGSNNGVYVSGSITGGSGDNVSITGTGGNSSGSSNHGIEVTGGTISTTGTGTMTVQGTGAGNTNSGNDLGLYVVNGGVISSQNGNLTINNSTGGGAGTGTNNYGIYVTGTGSTIETTGSGNISLTGLRGGGDTTTNYGTNIAVANGLQTTGTGTITVNTDTISLNAANNINSAGTLTITPYSIGTTIGLGGAAGTLGINLAYVTGTSVIIGRTDGTGNITVGAETLGNNTTIRTSSGNIEFSGAQTLGTKTLTATTASGNITMDQDAKIVSTASSGNSIVLAAGGNFVNNDSDDGSSALNAGSGTARYLVYSTSPNSNTLNGLSDSSHVFNKTYAGYAPASVTQTGNTFIYSVTPTLTVTADNKSMSYGDSVPSLTYTVTGFLSGDTASILTGSATISTAATNTSNVGSYTITGALGTLANSLGYSLSAANGTLTVGQRAVTVTADSGQSVVYGSNIGALTYTVTSGNLVNGDSFSGAITTGHGGAGTAATHANGLDAGSYAITQGTLANSNYAITYTGANLGVTPKGITITGFAANDKTYTGTNVATISSNGSLSGVVGADTVSINSGSASATFSDANAGAGKTVTAAGYALSGAQSGNYTLSSQPTTTATINKAVLTVTADNKSKTYGDANPALTDTITGYVNGENAGSAGVTGTASLSTAADSTSSVGNYTITAAANNLAAANYSFSYANGTLAIGQRAVTVTADSGQSVVYGSNIGALTYSVTSGNLVNGDSFSGALTTGHGGAGTAATHANGLDAGSYAITQGTLANSNYAITYTGANLGVTPKGITITGFAANDKTYTGTNTATISSNGSLSGVVGADTVSINAGGASATFSDANAGAGKTVTAAGYALSGAQSGNYTLSSQPTTTATINKAVLTVTADNKSKTYGDANPALTDTITGYVNGENAGSAGVTGSASLSTAADSTSSVGNYTITAAANNLAAANYSFNYANGTLAINQRAVTVTVDSGQSVVYGSNIGALTYSVTSGNLVNGDSFSGALTTGHGGAGTAATHANGLDVGSYAITQGTLANSNYAITYTGANLGVTPKGITITGFAANDKTYNGTNAATISSNGSLSGVVGADTVNINAGGASATFSDANAGAGKTVTAAGYALSGAQSGNYTLSSQPTTTATINKAVLTVTADNKSKTYGDANPALTDTITGYVNGENAGTAGVTGTASLSTAADNTSSVGNYTITAAANNLAAANYSFNYANGTLAIGQRAVTVTVDSGQSVVYGSNIGALTYSVTSGNLVNGDTFSGALTTAHGGAGTAATHANGLDVGNYAITQGSLDNSNYAITYTGANLGVTAKAITITGFAANDKTYNGSNAAVISSNGSLSGVVGADTVSINSSGASATFSDANAGAGKTVTAAGYALSGAQSSNYTLSSAPTTTATINKAVLTVTADNKSKTYGDANPALTDTITGFVNSENATTAGLTGTASLSTAADNTSSVGNYTITAAANNLAAANYSFSYANGTLAIGQRSLTVAANSGQTVVYGSNVGALTYTITSGSLVNGDALSGALTTAAGGAGTAATHANGLDVGNYAIMQGSLDNSNYAITYNGANLGVTPKGITITGFAANNKTYNGTNVATISSNGSLSGVVGADAVSINSSGASATFSDANAGAGKTVTAAGYALSGVQSGNYTLSSEPTTTATINKAVLTVTADNKSRVYGDANPALTDTITGFVNSENATTAGLTGTASLSTAANATSDVGSYTITAAANNLAAANYSFNYANGNLNVGARTLTAGLTGTVEKTYDATNSATLSGGNYTLSNIVNGDNVALNNPISGTYDNKNQGTGKTVTVSGLVLNNNAAGNYVLASNTINGAVGQIDKATLTLTPVSGTDKIYDATTTDTITGTASLVGKISGDVVNLNSGSAIGNFSDKNVGNGKVVTFTGYTISGADSGNYNLTQPANSTANITPAQLTVTADNKSRLQGDANPLFTSTITGFVGGEVLNTSGVTGAANLSTTADGSSAPGPYTITAALGTLAATNYNFALNNGTLTVNSVPSSGGGGGGGHVIIPTPPVTPPAPPVIPPIVVVPTPVTPTPVVTPPADNIPYTITGVSANPSLIYNSNTVNAQQGTPSTLNPGGYVQLIQAVNTAPIITMPTFNTENPQIAPGNSTSTSNNTSTLPRTANSIMQMYDPANDNTDIQGPHTTKASNSIPQDQDEKDKKEKIRRVLRENLERFLRVSRLSRRGDNPA